MFELVGFLEGKLVGEEELRWVVPIEGVGRLFLPERSVVMSLRMGSSSVTDIPIPSSILEEFRFRVVPGYYVVAVVDCGFDEPKGVMSIERPYVQT